MTRNGAVARVLGGTAVVILLAAYGLTMASAGSASASRAPSAAESARDVRPAPAETTAADETTAAVAADEITAAVAADETTAAVAADETTAAAENVAAETTGDASAATSGATEHAWAWVRSMLRTSTPITSD